jgi:hypothetical protein
MSTSTVALLLVLAAVACRWTAYRERVRPPRRFAPTARGWWVPPLPAAGEFATPAARRLEVLGRAFMYGGVAAMWWAALH